MPLDRSGFVHSPVRACMCSMESSAELVGLHKVVSRTSKKIDMEEAKLTSLAPRGGM